MHHNFCRNIHSALVSYSENIAGFDEGIIDFVTMSVFTHPKGVSLINLKAEIVPLDFASVSLDIRLQKHNIQHVGSLSCMSVCSGTVFVWVRTQCTV